MGTATGIGSGQANTAALVSKMGTTAYTSSHNMTITTTEEYAARLCDIYEIGGYWYWFRDWFLPSKDELDLMYDNLKEQGLGGFSNHDYWSSSEYNAFYAWSQDFYNGNQGYENRYREVWVRPVRAF